MNQGRVCHITSVHPSDDVRIYVKECKALAMAGWDVHLVAQGPISPEFPGFTHHVLPASSFFGRLGRMIFRAFKAYRMAMATKADVFHFHDPELLPWGLLLKWRGGRVIYDAHEDLPRDILSKPWIPSSLRLMVAWCAEAMENFVARRLDHVVAATPFICKRFVEIGANAVAINNYPQLGEFSVDQPYAANHGTVGVCYTGAITRDRGITEILKALPLATIRLQLAGSFAPPGLREVAECESGWQMVDFLGQVRRDRLRDIFTTSIAGLVLFHPVPNNVNAQPNKLFEYMSAGLPVIASDFPLWREIVERHQCGLCVDPLDPKAIAHAIEWVVAHPDEAKAMGARGKAAVVSTFHWEKEAERLSALYAAL